MQYQKTQVRHSIVMLAVVLCLIVAVIAGGVLIYNNVFQTNTNVVDSTSGGISLSMSQPGSGNVQSSGQSTGQTGQPNNGAAIATGERKERDHKVDRPYAGITYLPVPGQLAQQNDLARDQGAWVSDVAPNGPAAKAGLEVGDIILSINGQTIDGESPLTAAIAGCTPGSTVRVTYLRAGLTHEINLKLGTRSFASR